MRIMPHFSAEGLSNVYLIIDDDRNGIIVDPAHVDKELLEMIENFSVNLTAVLITHRHTSHTAGLGILMKIYNPKVYAYEAVINGFMTEQFKDGETKNIGTLPVKALHVPGHSYDSFVYLVDNSAIFTGDTLLSGSIASTHSFVERALLIRSLEMKVLPLDETALVYPGHGALTKLRIEKMLNQDLLQYESELGLFDKPKL